MHNVGYNQKLVRSRPQGEELFDDATNDNEQTNDTGKHHQTVYIY